MVPQAISKRARSFKVEIEEGKSYLFEEVENFKYLGATITKKNSEVKTRYKQNVWPEINAYVLQNEFSAVSLHR